MARGAASLLRRRGPVRVAAKESRTAERVDRAIGPVDAQRPNDYAQPSLESGAANEIGNDGHVRNLGRGRVRRRSASITLMHLATSASCAMAS
jgi:hypothetical protein